MSARETELVRLAGGRIVRATVIDRHPDSGVLVTWGGMPPFWAEPLGPDSIETIEKEARMVRALDRFEEDAARGLDITFAVARRGGRTVTLSSGEFHGLLKDAAATVGAGHGMISSGPGASVLATVGSEADLARWLRWVADRLEAGEAAETEIAEAAEAAGEEA